MTDERLEAIKRSVTAFCRLMFDECRPQEAIDRYAGERYIQHNPHVANGKKAFIGYFERMDRRALGHVAAGSGEVREHQHDVVTR